MSIQQPRTASNGDIKPDSSNLAVLIDGDNVSSKHVSGLMAEIANYGTASVRRIYGDWTTPGLGAWKSCLLKHSITPIQQFAYTTGKNATDGAMIIDAMDLMYTGRFSGFCIVSSDSDFTRLATRIREQGLTVYGFGERKTNYAFIAACDKFTYFDVLPVDPSEEPTASRPPQQGYRPAAARPQMTPRPLDQVALNALEEAISNSISYAGGYANLAEVGHLLSRKSANLNARNYGYPNLTAFVEASRLADFRIQDMGNRPPITLVRLKDHVMGDV
ncbi:hypothetical protein BU24DRAFT_261478 [Aaosphaeria arxii CBS 175.79]|uniref:HTH OST-type domain-containing protein n=1 Tax=Aaosphaeria arxii CBS 175.79 TaxID=1450172 RepID=A0A6A5XKW2_9PLEO|nr:uncharacterized protein BU24DRAFT_261478 [Aaosphaeria arxii CBS 175.79]KAF2012934.1 hypothetical protein BU24DRAFT_261478 [Aaosphaeria arxii CBS 175.79]